MAAMSFREYQQRDLELCDLIAHYEQDSANHTAQFAINNREISVLEMKRKQLRMEYSCAEFGNEEVPA